MDKFSVYCHRVKKALNAYEQVRVLYGASYKGLQDTIYRKAKPFVEGHFTLAVIGKTSSGKSTFINALLGNRSLLPTAYEQTTCTLTEIEYGDSLQIQVEYGDGNIKTFTDAAELLQFAAIPTQYQHLPINLINKLILAGRSENDIVKGKEELGKQQGENIDENLLREYIRSHSADNIPTKVVIKYPLPESYKGWKIIDTPGVSSLGGIEKETRDFLNGKNEYGYNNVDAIIFVNSTRNGIQDKDFKEFVDQTLLNLAPEAKKRIFLLITHATDSEFMRNKDSSMEFARRIFVEKMKIKSERLICIDSICYLFVLYAKSCGKPISSFKKKEVPLDWDPKVWESCIDARNYFRNALEEKDKEVNNENLIQLCEQVSGFKKLRVQLDTFIAEEKSIAFSQLMKFINKDISAMLNDIKQKKSILEKSVKYESLEVLRNRLNEEKNKLDASKKDFNETMIKFRNKFSKDPINKEFEEFFDKILLIREKRTMREVQLGAENILSEVEKKKSDITEDLLSTIEKMWDENCSLRNVYLPNIDFQSIALEVEQNNTYTEGGELEGYETKKVKQKGFIAGFLRLIHAGGYEIIYDYNKPIYSPEKTHFDEAGAVHEFANRIYKEFFEGMKIFVEKIITEIRTICDKVNLMAKELIQSQEKSYDRLMEENQTLEEQMKSVAAFDLKIDKIQGILFEIKNKQ